MFFKNCEFVDYPPIASEYVKDSGTSDSSKNYPGVDPQTIRLKGLILINEKEITTTLNEAKLERLWMYIIFLFESMMFKKNLA